MKFQQLEIEGYGSYHGVHTVPLDDQGLVLVLGDNQDEPRMDSNGAAKSTPFEAIDWALFGVVPKGDHVDSVINDESSIARVRVTLFDDDAQRPVVVQREKSRGKAAVLQYWVAGAKNAALDARETQRLLERELGIDRDVFHAAVFYAQTDLLGFADSTEAKRMELLSKVLPELAQIDEWLEPAKQIAKAYAERLTSCRAEAARAQTQSEEASRALSTFDAQVKQWEEGRLQRARALEVGREQQIAASVKNEQTIEQVKRARAELAAMIEPGRIEVEGISQEIQTARQHEKESWGHVQGAREQASRLLARKQRLQQESSGTCSVCGQVISAEHLARELAVIDEQVVWEQNRAATAETTMKQFQQKIRELQERTDTFRVAQQAYVKRKGELAGWLHHAERSIQDPEHIRQYIARLEAEHAAVMQAPNPVQAQKEKWRARASELTQSAQVAFEATGQCERSLGLADFWVSAFGQKGLRNYVLDHRLKEMTDAANQWVRLLTGGTIWVRFETQKMGRSTKKLSNEINVRVFRFNPTGHIVERNYKSWSGGEKRRVAWAIDFGLSRLIAARARKRYDMLVLDEVFRHVDASGGEAVVEMLHELRKERSSIFVIEHDSAFQAHFEKQWIAVKKNARSVLRGSRERIPNARSTAVVEGSTENSGEATKALPSRTPVKAKRKPVRRASRVNGT